MFFKILNRRSNNIYARFDNWNEICKKHGFKEKSVKSIFNKSKGERSFFLEDYTLNPYLGCSFNCSYCYINGSKYAKDTDSFFIKSNAVNLVKTQLKNKLKKGEKALFNIGSASDPYQDIEKDIYLTRDILKNFHRFKFPVHIITKSDLILRDIDILRKIDEEAILPNDISEELSSKVIISFSFSTIDESIGEIFESSVPSIKRRLNAISKLSSENFIVGVAFMPILPLIADNPQSIKKAIYTFNKHGVDFIIPGGMSLFGEGENSSRERYFNLVKEHFPQHFEETKELFYNRKTGVFNDYPLGSHYKKVYNNIVKESKKYGIKNSII